MIIWLVLVLTLTGCSSGAAAPTLSPTEGVVLLNGLYTTTLTADDLAKNNSLDPNLPNMVGTWRVTLSKEGKFNAEIEGLVVGSGMYTVRGSEIEIYVSSVCTDCPCDESIGRYTWTLQNDQLSMTKKAGSCDLMHALFTTHPLKRLP